MNVITKQTAKLGEFTAKMGSSFADAGEVLATIVMKKPGKAEEVRTKNGSTTVCKNSGSAFTTMFDALVFYGRGGKYFYETLWKHKNHHSFLDMNCLPGRFTHLHFQNKI